MIFTIAGRRTNMPALSASERLGEIASLRAKLKTNDKARSALTIALRGAFSEANITLDPSIESSLIIAIPEELSENLNNVILPGGTNCS
jgi:hypothetical protein